MDPIIDLRSNAALLALHNEWPGALVLVYFYKADIDLGASRTAERSYRSVASSIQSTSFHRPIIFTRLEIDSDPIVRDCHVIDSVPIIHFFMDGQVIRKLEEITDTRVWKYVNRFGDPKQPAH